MVIVALVCFVALLIAWILAPDDAERVLDRAVTEREPAVEPALEPELAAA